MNKVLCFGSLNIDHVYEVDDFVKPGETLASNAYAQFAGGKGANQSIALARAGVNILHAGKIGKDGTWLLNYLQDNNVDTTNIDVSNLATGHAVIQVDAQGENCILLSGGANTDIDTDFIDRTLQKLSGGDYVLLQNEINNIDYIIAKAKALGLIVVLNPAPYNAKVQIYPLSDVDILILNEIEAKGLADTNDTDDVLHGLSVLYPTATIVITLGKKGVVCQKEGVIHRVDAYKVNAVDTTAAGDCFIGYFLSSLLKGEAIDEALTIATKAASICVTRPGAMQSIPLLKELL